MDKVKEFVIFQSDGSNVFLRHEVKDRVETILTSDVRSDLTSTKGYHLSVTEHDDSGRYEVRVSGKTSGIILDAHQLYDLGLIAAYLGNPASGHRLGDANPEFTGLILDDPSGGELSPEELAFLDSETQRELDHHGIGHQEDEEII